MDRNVPEIRKTHCLRERVPEVRSPGRGRFAILVCGLADMGNGQTNFTSRLQPDAKYWVREKRLRRPAISTNYVNAAARRATRVD